MVLVGGTELKNLNGKIKFSKSYIKQDKKMLKNKKLKKLLTTMQLDVSQPPYTCQALGISLQQPFTIGTSTREELKVKSKFKTIQVSFPVVADEVIQSNLPENQQC